MTGYPANQQPVPGGAPSRFGIVSGSSQIRLRSYVNHKIYASLHGHDYRLETGPFPGMRSPFFLKVHALEYLLPKYEWILWIDDDAYFTDFRRDIFKLVADPDLDNKFLIACKSPVNRHGKWTFLNSGVFLLKNCPRAHQFLAEVKATSTIEVRNKWKEKTYGLYSDGEQDIIIHLLHKMDLLPEMLLLQYEAFNARAGHYSDRIDEHLICHFAGVGNKAAAISAFAARFGVGETLVPNCLAGRFDLPCPSRPSPSLLDPLGTAPSVAAWLRRLRERGPPR